MTKKIDYDPNELHETFDAAYLATFEAAVALGKLKDGDYVLALDGSARAFTGKSYFRSKKRPEREDDELSIAGRWTDPAFSGKKGNQQGGTPTYPGTVNKHSWLQFSGHLYDTKESFCLGVRRGRPSAESLQDLIRALNHLPIMPSFLLADKEFPNSKKIEALRPWCDENRVVVCCAHSKNKATRRAVLNDWHQKLALPVQGATKPIYWSCRPHYWRTKGRTKYRPFNLLTIYFEDDPRKDFTNEIPELESLPNGVYAASFYVSIEVTAENVLWIYEHYSLRWSCENLYKRYKAYCGRSGSSKMFLRDYFYNAAMLLLNTYALWRMERSRRLELRLHHPLVSLSRFFGDLQETCRDRLLAAQLGKRTGTPARELL